MLRVMGERSYILGNLHHYDLDTLMDTPWFLSIPNRYSELLAEHLQAQVRFKIVILSRNQLLNHPALLPEYESHANAYVRQRYKMLPFFQSQWMARLRLGDHHLRVKRDRYRGIPRAERRCWFDAEVDDEYLIECDIVENYRPALWRAMITKVDDQAIRGRDDRLMFHYLISRCSGRHVASSQ